MDDHNDIQYALPSLEDTWVTERWAIWVLTSILDITEVNIYLAIQFFVWAPDKVLIYLQFRAMLA